MAAKHTAVDPSDQDLGDRMLSVRASHIIRTVQDFVVVVLKILGAGVVKQVCRGVIIHVARRLLQIVLEHVVVRLFVTVLERATETL